MKHAETSDREATFEDKKDLQVDLIVVKSCCELQNNTYCLFEWSLSNIIFAEKAHDIKLPEANDMQPKFAFHSRGIWKENTIFVFLFDLVSKKASFLQAGLVIREAGCWVRGGCAYGGGVCMQTGQGGPTQSRSSITTAAAAAHRPEGQKKGHLQTLPLSRRRKRDRTTETGLDASTGSPPHCVIPAVPHPLPHLTTSSTHSVWEQGGLALMTLTRMIHTYWAGPVGLCWTVDV